MHAFLDWISTSLMIIGFTILSTLAIVLAMSLVRRSAPEDSPAEREAIHLRPVA
jgi:hypothetical protein